MFTKTLGRTITKAQAQRYHARDQFHCDAATSLDPTGTSGLRKRYRASVELRFKKVRRLLQQTIVSQDILQLGTTDPSAAALAASMLTAAVVGIQGHTNDGKIKAFQIWLDQTLLRIVQENTGAYLDPMIAAAYKAGLVRGQKLTGKNVTPENAMDAIGSLKQLTFTELQGICEAVSQRVVREISLALLHNDTKAALYARVGKIVDVIGITRARSMINQMVVQTFNQALLNQFAVAGVTRVGLVPETVRPSQVMPLDGKRRLMARYRRGRPYPHQDAGGPGSRVARSLLPSSSTIGRIQKVTAALTSMGEVDILTAEDPCPECEDLEAEGPYDILEALSLIPAHPNCRCTFVPSDESLHDEFNEEDHPRGPDGKFGEGGGSKKLVEKGKSNKYPELKGNSGERKQIREDMKKPGADRKAQADKLVHSFAVERDRALSKGNADRVAALNYKITGIENKYGINSGLGAKSVPAPKFTPPPAVIAPPLAKVTPPPSAQPPAPAGNLSMAERDAIRSYTGNGYIELNKGLREGVMTEGQWNKVQKINSGLDKLPPYIGTVRRQAILGSEVYTRYKPGMIIEERGFTSTSSKESWAWQGGTTYEIKSQTGRSVAHLSNHLHEKEVLFKSGTRFRVTKAEGKVIHMEEV